MSAIPPPPPGYVPESSVSSVPPPPPGYVPETASPSPAIPPPPPGYVPEDSVRKTLQGVATPAMTAQFTQQHPIVGNIVNAGMAIDKGATTAIGKLLSYVAPQTGANLQEHANAVYPDAPGIVSTVGETVGGLIPTTIATLSSGGAAIPEMIAEGFGGAREDAARLRNEGKDVSQTAEFTDAFGQAGLNGFLGKVLGGATSKAVVEGLSAKLAPLVPDMLAKYGPHGIQAAIAQVATKFAAGGTTNVAAGLGSRAITAATVDPNQQVLPSARQAGGEVLTGGLQENVLQGRETVEGLRDAASAAQKPQGGAEPAQSATVPETTAPPASNTLSDLRARMEASRSEGGFGPAYEGTQAQIDQMHRARIAEESKPKPEPTPEEYAARERKQLDEISPDATIEKYTGDQDEELAQRLHDSDWAADQRVSTEGENQGRRETDMPAHEFKTPEAVEQEGLKSKLTPSETVRTQAEGYAKQAGIDHQPDRNYEPVDTDRAKQIADSYEAMQHDPSDPKVKASYDALKKETLDQYNYLKDQGVTIEQAPASPAYPSSKSMMEDVAAGHLFYDKTADGILPANHPLAEEAPGTGGMKYNDVFRAVHDYFGHAQEGNGFGPKGEEHAWKQHAAMYSDEARPAMTAETRGQNSWVNYGPKGAENQSNPQNTTFAQQKAGLLPEEFNGGKSASPAAPATPAAPAQGSTLFGKIRNAVTGAVGKVKSAVSDSPAARTASLSIRKSLGDAELASHQFEATLADAREHLPTFSDDPAAAKSWMDQVEKGEVPAGSHPAVEKAIKMLQEKRMENAQDATDLGIKHLDVDGEGLSRMFTFPGNENGPGTTSLAGTNNPLRGQKYDTFSEAYDAAIAHGGQPKFDNGLDMQIARQYQVDKNLSGRRNLRDEEDAARAKWVPEGEKAPEGTSSINDRILGSESRKESLPASLVGRAADMKMFDANKFLDAHASQVAYTRPGPNLDPDTEGHAFTGRETNGQFYMPKDVAQKFNNFSEVQPQDSVAEFVKNVARGSLKLRYSLSMGHSAKAAMNMAGVNLSNAFREGGDFGATVSRLMDAGTAGQITGSKFRRAAESGANDEATQRVMAVNPALRLRSVTKPSWAEGIKNNWSEGKYGQAIYDAINVGHNLQFNEVLPNMVAAHLKGVADRQIRQGVSAEAGRPQMAAEADAIQNLIGAHITSPEYRNTVTQAVLDTAMPAARYWQGQLANVKNALAGDKAARTAVWSAFAGATAATFLASTAAQMLMTHMNTGHAQPPQDINDLINPRTGNQDENGNPERVNYGSTVADAYNFAKNPVRSGMNKLNPALAAAQDTYHNKDQQGNQVMPDDASTGEKALDAAGHLAKGLTSSVFTEPFKPNAPEAQPRTSLQKARDEALGVVGVRTSHPTDSAAQQTLFDALHAKAETGGRDLRASAIETNTARWAEELRSGKDPQEVGADMQDQEKYPWMNDSIADSVVKRAQAKPGLESLVQDTKITPWDLTKAWDKATPAEQDDLRRGIYTRMGNVDTDTMAKDELSEWQNLKTKLEQSK
jgi:hypothetical protein